MPSSLTDTTGDGVPRLAAIELRYELAKAHIAGVATRSGDHRGVHDTVAVDVAATKPPLAPARPAVVPAAQAPRPGRRFWRSLRLPQWIERSLPAS